MFIDFKRWGRGWRERERERERNIDRLSFVCSLTEIESAT